MLLFEDIYKIIDLNSHETAFSREESKAYFDLLMSLPEKSNVVEIGVQFGRSTMISAFVSKEHDLNLTSIDNWSDGYGPQAKAHVESWMEKYNLKFNLWSANSNECHTDYKDTIDLLFIDGDHNFEGVMNDCIHWIPKVKFGGFIAFHDYGRDSLPSVYAAVENYMTNPTIKINLINHVYTLGIFKKE